MILQQSRQINTVYTLWNLVMPQYQDEITWNLLIILGLSPLGAVRIRCRIL